MNVNNTMLVLIGFQNDYFAPEGILRGVIDEAISNLDVVGNTVRLIRALAPTPLLMVDTPILFTSDFRELPEEPKGILKAIKATGAFRRDSTGSQTIPELTAFGDRIRTVPGKHGLNAFSNTELDQLVTQRQINHILLAGAVTSVCIDSTGRSAYERNLGVHILSDCTSARTSIEQQFYCERIFPIYAEVLTSEQCLERLEIA